MKYILNNDNLEVVGKQYLEGVGNYTGDTTNASDLATVINDMPIEKGETEHGIVLKGGDNQVISDFGIALGKDNLVGLKGWYYGSIYKENDNTISVYLSNEQKAFNTDEDLKTEQQAADESLPNLVEILGVNAVISLVNAGKYDDKFIVISGSNGVVRLQTIDESVLPFDIITGQSVINYEDYSIYCLSKPDAGIAELGKYSFAVGYNNKTTNGESAAFGYNNHAYGKFSFVEGKDNKAGYASHAEGRSNIASGSISHAEGRNNVASGYLSHAEGGYNIAEGPESHAEGYYTTAKGAHSHAEGYSTEALGDNSHAEGYNTEAKGVVSHAEGYNTTATGEYSHSEGYSTEALGDNSHAEGNDTKATGYNSHAEGYKTHAKGNYTHSEGQETSAEGKWSHAEGFKSQSKGDYSHAEGQETLATNEHSHAEGFKSQAIGAHSHAEGNDTKSEGINSHAEGNKSYSLGPHSHAEGNETKTESSCAHAEGYKSQALGKYSHAEGNNTISKNEAEHACGKYNLSNSDTRFSIGIGTSEDDRKNAFEVKQNGDIYIEGVEGRIQDKLDKLVNITYSKLKSLRDSSQLIPGQQYRITDYVTTSSQPNTTSAGHQFDVIVTALDKSTLSENASAIMHDGDTYFETENLEAWQLKYCLDNDTERFAWADNREIDYITKVIGWYQNDPASGNATPYSVDDEDTIYEWVTLAHPDTGEPTIVLYAANPTYYNGQADDKDGYFYNGIVTVDNVEYDSWKIYDFAQDGWTLIGGSIEKYALTERIVFDGEVVKPVQNTGTRGKGVIYRMIDEYGNECPYDFKNIMFYHDGLGTNVYTFTWIDDGYNVMDTSIFGNNGILTYYDEIYGVYGNVIKPYMGMIYDEDSGDYLGTKQILNNIIFISDYEYEGSGNEGFHGCYSNTFGNNCSSNIFGNYCSSNIFGNYCNNNIFINNCHSNSFGNECYSNSFGYYCYNNSFGNGCFRNSFSTDCYNNIFGNNCHSNSFGNNCYYNSLGNICYSNSFGNDCYSNSLGNTCYFNSFGNKCYVNSFGNNCDYNRFGNKCKNNIFGSNCYYNSLGNGCIHNSFRKNSSNTATLLSYCCCNHFDDGCSYNIIWNLNTINDSNKLQNININRGVSGTSSDYNFINVDTLNAGYEIQVAKNSSGVIKVYCEADLIA